MARSVLRIGFRSENSKGAPDVRHKMLVHIRDTCLYLVVCRWRAWRIRSRKINAQHVPRDSKEDWRRYPVEVIRIFGRVEVSSRLARVPGPFLLCDRPCTSRQVCLSRGSPALRLPVYADCRLIADAD